MMRSARSVCRIVVVLAAVLAIASADKANDKFKQCCQAANIPCTEMCVHPPFQPSPSQQKCVGNHFPQYLNCATGEKDNRKCCEAANVSKGGKNKQCLDLCWPSGIKPTVKLLSCLEVRDQISKCNHDANES